MKSVSLLLAVLMMVGIGACAPLAAINAITPGNDYDRHDAIAYGDDVRQKLDVYTPRERKTPAPVVVFFYGGTWNSGARADYKFVGQALASRGMVAVVADYRLYPQVRYPGILQDSAHAVAWTLKNIRRYGGDPAHVFVFGHSAGAYNAAMMALDPRWLEEAGATPEALRGWIGLAGPYDFLPVENPEARPVFFFPDSPPASQPINHVTAKSPPALLIAALDDHLVNPQRNTRAMADKLHAAGVDATAIFYDRHLSHATLVATLAWPLRWWAPVLDRIEQFVKSDGNRQAMPSR